MNTIIETRRISSTNAINMCLSNDWFGSSFNKIEEFAEKISAIENLTVEHIYHFAQYIRDTEGEEIFDIEDIMETIAKECYYFYEIKE